MRILIMTVFAGLLFIGHAWAGEVEIVAATAVQKGKTWTFAVTLKHADSGWDHYADAWRVVSAKGKVLGSRTLFHPHENEQPFTRSLSRVVIMDTTEAVYIEAHDKVHGWAKERFEVGLQAP
jgi:hypothetical protein